MLSDTLWRHLYSQLSSGSDVFLCMRQPINYQGAAIHRHEAASWQESQCLASCHRGCVLVCRCLPHSQDGSVLRPADPINARKQHLSADGVSDFHRKKNASHEMERIQMTLKTVARNYSVNSFMLVKFVGPFYIGLFLHIKKNFFIFFKYFNRKKKDVC